jgi:comEA protein
MNNKEKTVLYFLISSIIIGSSISLYKRQNERKNLSHIKFEIDEISSPEITPEYSGIKTEKERNQYPVNINQATMKELEALTGIGPVLAQRIINERNRVGKFSCPEDLLKVKGIGPKILIKIRDKIIINN